MSADESEAELLDESPADPKGRFVWRRHVLLFVATCASVMAAGASSEHPEASFTFVLSHLLSGWTYAVPLLAILLTHEFGHYFAARAHHVDASLPYFIPFPFLSPFGTMGAVISMRGRIRSRNALLDIGASGPLAGLCVALPVLAYGLAHSEVKPLGEHGYMEGQSLLYLVMKRVVLGPIPDGYDVMLSPVAFAGWTGLFVTALNLLPIQQLDGGHIAYALFENRQHRYGRIVHRLLLVAFLINLARFVIPVIARHAWGDIAQAATNSMFWLFWYGLLHVMARFAGRDHPPTEPGELSPVRRVLAVVSLVFFVLLFMPAPWTAF